jgi:hypothetical protein
VLAVAERDVETLRPPVHGRLQIVLLRAGQGDGRRLAGHLRGRLLGLGLRPAHGEEHRDQRLPRASGDHYLFDRTGR